MSQAIASLMAYTRHRSQFFIAVALLALGVYRFLPGATLQGLDRLLGHSGDTVLLLAAVLVLCAWRRAPASTSASNAADLKHPALDPIDSLLETHLALEGEIDKKLQEVIVDTERSAHSIIGQVRQLYDSANVVVVYLENSSAQASNLSNDIVDSVTYLVEIGQFIQELPAKMTRDLNSVQSVVHEITALSTLVSSVHAISMQSHLLAINAAIEGSRAGPSGAAFRVVADEMRLLASNSSAVALKINQGLARARAVVEGGMATRIAESEQAFSEVSQAVVSIQKLKDNFEDMNQYFKTRFAVITQHNQSLAKDIVEVLGQIQYQDVVSQCIERIRKATSKRNAFFQEAVTQVKQPATDLAQLQPLLALILSQFLEEEEKHKHSARHDEQADGALKFELF